MSRKPLSYVENLQKRGTEAAQERLQKNQEAFDAKIAAMKEEIAAIEQAKVQDQADYKAAVKSYAESLTAQAVDAASVVDDDDDGDGDGDNLGSVL